MASTVEEYLAHLRVALTGADPALVQDAVYDAEEYLRSAVADGDGSPEALAATVEAYGQPEEVASSYRDTERAVTAALRKPAAVRPRTAFGRFFGVVGDPVAWGAFLYMLLALVTGVVYFTLVVTGLSLTVGLAILIIGVPFALLFIAVVRAISLAEGRLVEGLLGTRMPRRPRTVGAAGTGTLMMRVKSWFIDIRTWTTMLYMVLMLPLGIIYFTLLVTALTVSLVFTVTPWISAIWHLPIMSAGGARFVISWWAVPLMSVVGVVGLVVTMWMAKGIGHLHGAFAKAMLVGRLEPETGVDAPARAMSEPAV